MPVAKVQLPDGRVARLEVPEGTTGQQVESFVFENLQKGADFSNPEKPSAMARLGRGFMDVAQGVKQVGTALGEKVASKVLGESSIDPEKSDLPRQAREGTDEINLYEKGRAKDVTTQSDLIKGQHGDAGMDWMRLAGNVLGTLPTMMVGGGVTSLGARAAVGAGQGAASSAAMFTPEGESKLKQTLVGAGFGAAAPVVLDGIKMAWRAGANRLASDTMDPAKNGALRTALSQDLETALKANGIDWKGLTADVQNSFLKDAAAALKTGGKLDAEALARNADIQAVGARPTAASVTRQPKDWQTEMNLRAGPGGEMIMRRHSENARAMTDYLGQLRQKTGGMADTALEAGESATKALQNQDKAKETAVGKLYDAFRESGAQDATVPATKMADALGKVADEIGTENIPAAVQSRLKEFGLMGSKQTKLLTVNEADKLNRLLNNNNPGNGPGSLAIGRLKSALNEALLDVEPAGQQGVEALKTARAAAAQRFREAEASKGISAALDDVSPDNFVQKFIVKAPVRDLAATKAELMKSPQGQQALKDVKGHILDTLLLKGTGASSVDALAARAPTEATFSGSAFGKALDAIEPEKLHMLFTPDEIGALRTLQRASKNLTTEVPFSDVSHGTRVGALASLFLKIGGGLADKAVDLASHVPLAGKIVVGAYKAGDEAAKRKAAMQAAAEALLGKIPVEAGQKAKVALPVYGFERAIPGAAGAIANQPGNSQ